MGPKVTGANRANLRKSNAELPGVNGEFDDLMGVSDATRMGDIRLRFPNGRWQSPDDGVADIHNLDNLVKVAARYENDEATDEEVAYLNDIATSPGGCPTQGQRADEEWAPGYSEAPSLERWRPRCRSVGGCRPDSR